MTEQMERPRVLLSKLGLDGHDRGVRLLARVLRDEGYEVVVLGIGSTPPLIARAAVDEDVDVVGISILSGAHLVLVPDVMAQLREEEAEDIPVVVGGTIPQRDVETLVDMGVSSVVPTGSSVNVAVRCVEDALVGA